MCTHFVFAWKPFLNFGKIQKEQAQIRYMQAVNQVRTEKEKLVALKEQFLQSMNLFQESQKGLVPVERFKMFQHYFDKMKEDIRIQQNAVQEAAQRQKECLRALEEALKNVSVVEKFRERRLQQYQLEVLAEEQKQLDEIGLQIYSRA